MRDRIWHALRIALLAATASLMFASVAWGQDYGRYNDDDRYNDRDQARDQGYRNGYRDGLRIGQSDAERGRRFKFKNDDWEDSRGYQHWMGDKGRYKHEYREGYERGYRQGYSSYGYRRDRDRDDWR
jgi:flagellar biosynthesis/type III secretory pathway protein FliH